MTDPLDLAGIDDLLSPEEEAVRAAVRQVCDASIEPYIGRWYEDGELPVVRELAKEPGSLGLLRQGPRCAS